MNDIHTIEANIFERLSHVIDPELGRSVTDLGMITSIEAMPSGTVDENGDGIIDVTVHVELTVKDCPLSETITNQINGTVRSYVRDPAPLTSRLFRISRSAPCHRTS